MTAAALTFSAPAAPAPSSAAAFGWFTRRCRVCGCTQMRACPGGCWWVDMDLCSRCAPRARGLRCV